MALSQRQLATYRKSLAEFEETRTNLEEELKSLHAVHKAEAQKISDIQMQGINYEKNSLYSIITYNYTKLIFLNLFCF